VQGPYVIVGAGQAGLQIAESLRHEKYDGPIILLGAEAHAPYNRPPLSKHWLIERRSPTALAIRSMEAIARRNIDLRVHTTVTAIDREAKLLTCADGEKIAYGGLALATGAAIRRLAVPGAVRAFSETIWTDYLTHLLKTHGEHAVACTLMGIVLMPISRRKVVGTLAVSSTTTVFAPAQLGSDFEHFVWTATATLGTPGIEFFEPFRALYAYAVEFAVPASGKRAAPASDAASADACSWMRVRYACPRSMTRPANSRMQTMKAMTRGRVWPSSLCGVRCAKGEPLLPSGQAARAGAT